MPIRKKALFLPCRELTRREGFAAIRWQPQSRASQPYVRVSYGARKTALTTSARRRRLRSTPAIFFAFYGEYLAKLPVVPVASAQLAIAGGEFGEAVSVRLWGSRTTC